MQFKSKKTGLETLEIGPVWMVHTLEHKQKKYILEPSKSWLMPRGYILTLGVLTYEIV